MAPSDEDQTVPEAVGLIAGDAGQEQSEKVKKAATDEPVPAARGKRFWAILFALQLSTLIVATETNVAATSLPRIVADLQFKGSFDWVLNAYNLMSTVVQPPVGQFSDIFGRKPVIMGGLILFMLGSAICGAAADPATLVFGRAVQGAGGGILQVLAELIISDLVSLKERASFLGGLMAISALGLVIGPFVGGFITEHFSWRWIYYLNVPIGLVALIMLQLFLTMSHQRDPDWRKNIARIEFVGILLFIVSTTLILVGLSSSNPSIASLAVGCALMVVFAVHQNSRWCREPLMPRRLFNLDSSLAFGVNFLLAMVQIAVPYFFAIYLEALLGHSPAQSGTDLIPLFIIFLPVAGISGAVISKTGKYRLSHIISMGFLALAMASCMLLTRTTMTIGWVLCLALVSVGMGASVPSLLPAAQAPLPDADSAAITATFSFLRALGFVWGIFGSTLLFNYKIDSVLFKVADPAVVKLLQKGGAYSRAGAAFMDSLPEAIREQVYLVYDDGLKAVWQGLMAVSLMGLVLSWMERDVVMRKTLETEFGLGKETQEPSSEIVKNWRNTSSETVAEVHSGLNL